MSLKTLVSVVLEASVAYITCHRKELNASQECDTSIRNVLTVLQDGRDVVKMSEGVEEREEVVEGEKPARRVVAVVMGDGTERSERPQWRQQTKPRTLLLFSTSSISAKATTSKRDRSPRAGVKAASMTRPMQSNASGLVRTAAWNVWTRLALLWVTWGFSWRDATCLTRLPLSGYTGTLSSPSTSRVHPSSPSLASTVRICVELAE